MRVFRGYAGWGPASSKARSKRAPGSCSIPSPATCSRRARRALANGVAPPTRPAGVARRCARRPQFELDAADHVTDPGHRHEKVIVVVAGEHIARDVLFGEPGTHRGGQPHGFQARLYGEREPRELHHHGEPGTMRRLRGHDQRGQLALHHHGVRRRKQTLGGDRHGDVGEDAGTPTHGQRREHRGEIGLAGGTRGRSVGGRTHRVSFAGLHRALSPRPRRRAAPRRCRRR